jgi:hypothetical protein
MEPIRSDYSPDTGIGRLIGKTQHVLRSSIRKQVLGAMACWRLAAMAVRLCWEHVSLMDLSQTIKSGISNLSLNHTVLRVRLARCPQTATFTAPRSLPHLSRMCFNPRTIPVSFLLWKKDRTMLSLMVSLVTFCFRLLQTVGQTTPGRHSTAMC